jgi:hypothetical protein
MGRFDFVCFNTDDQSDESSSEQNDESECDPIFEGMGPPQKMMSDRNVVLTK